MILTAWLNHKTSKAQKKNQEIRQSIGYKDAESLGILFNNDDHSKIEAAEKLSTLIKMDGKKVKILTYEKRNQIKHLPFDSISKENFNFWGSHVGKPINDFVEANFDFLICLDENPNNFVRSILANSMAKCRIGRYEEKNEALFEMLLQDKSEHTESWVQSLYNYLKIIS